MLVGGKNVEDDTTDNSFILVGIVALTFLFIFPTVTSAFASPFTAMYNQTLTQNDAGVIILGGATVIDGTKNW